MMKCWIKYKISSKLLLLLALLCLPASMIAQVGQGSNRTVPPAIVDSFRNDKNYAYANDAAYWQKKPAASRGNQWTALIKFLRSAPVRWTVYLLLVAIFIFVLYRILYVLGVFDSRIKSAKVKDKHDLETIARADLDGMLKDAVRTGDLRLATRYQYLLLLKNLSDHKLVQLQARATNHDYILQLEQSRFAGQFRFLTRAYEYVWYGERKLSETQYENLQQSFADLKSQLPD